jgi:ribosomal protein S18 acetylase RimI-like enzyme
MLAGLDAAAFPPLWHFGVKDLFEMLMRCRVQLAWWQGQLAGYAALCANNRSEGQLARLAVHPSFQGRGIGRALLADAITYAAQEFAVLVLNTQVTNTRSQTLYRGFGFRAIGLPVAVLARQAG